MATNSLRPLVLIFMLFTVSNSWALTLSDVVKRVEDNYKNIVAYRGNFNQTTTLKTLKKIQQGQGEILYKKPNKIKWRYTSPTEQEIISDGKNIWMYFPENRQVYIYDLTDTFAQEVSNQGQIPGNFLTTLGNLSSDSSEFNVQWGAPRSRDARGNYIIELVPKRPIVNVRNIFLVVPRYLVETNIKKEDWRNYCDSVPDDPTKRNMFPICASTVYDTYGNMTNIELLDIDVLETADEKDSTKKKAWTLSDNIFTYLPPANVEIIKPPLTRSK